MSHSNSNIFPFESVDLTHLFTSSPAPFTDSSAVSLQEPPSDHPREALTEISTNQASKPVNHRGPNWSIAEDVQLCHSWLETSLDPIEGVDQKGDQFWTRIFKHYVDRRADATKESTQKDPIRTPTGAQQRWGVIQHAVNKFCGAYASAERRHKTGQVALDRVAQAHDIYIACNKGKKFTLQHCWEVLRLHQKWESKMEDLAKDEKGVKTTTQTKRKQSEAGIDLTSDPSALPTSDCLAPPDGSSSDQFQPRPKGRRKAKAERLESSTSGKLNVKNSQSNTSFDEAKKYMSELIAVSREKTDAINTASSSAQRMNDDQIMLMDTSNMTGTRRAYIEHRQAQIWSARQAQKPLEDTDDLSTNSQVV